MALWLLAAAAGVAVIAGGAAAGLWFVPFAAGLAAGLANRIGGWRVRVLVPAVAAMAIAGWGIPLWWPTLHGSRPAAPRGSSPRWPACRPPRAAGMLVTLMVGVLQGLAGLWLGRARTPPPCRTIPGAGIADADAPGAADAGAADVRALDARAADAGAADASAASVRFRRGAGTARCAARRTSVARVSGSWRADSACGAADVGAADVRFLGAGAQAARTPGGWTGGRADSPAPRPTMGE